jgi:hypothetical protein
MAAVQPADTTGPTTEEGFLADRLAFWDRFTGATLKVTASLIVFCAWLWWATFAGFTFFHVIALPIVIIGLMLIL